MRGTQFYLTEIKLRMTVASIYSQRNTGLTKSHRVALQFSGRDSIKLVSIGVKLFFQCLMDPLFPPGPSLDTYPCEYSDNSTHIESLNANIHV